MDELMSPSSSSSPDENHEETRLSRAFHGSPYRFDAFSLSHINNGEGSQTYGWGLYFASKREIAEWYKKELEKNVRSWSFRVGEQNISKGNPDFEAADMAWLVQQYGPVDSDWLGAEIAARGLPFEDSVERFNRLVLKNIERHDGGQIYEVEIPEDDTMLVWDRPLSAQPDKVRKALVAVGLYEPPGGKEESFADKYAEAVKAEGGDPAAVKRAILDLVRNPQLSQEAWDVLLRDNPQPEGFDLNTIHDDLRPQYWDGYYDQTTGEHVVRAVNESGSDLYKSLESAMGSDEAASKYLHSLGINGIKYLDGVSRDNGEGTYNYVIFDDRAVQIVQTFFSRGEASPFYSQLAKAVMAMPGKVDNTRATNVKAWLLANAGKLGIKQEEIFWTGVLEWLDAQGSTNVSKEDLAAYLEQGGVKVDEVMLKEGDWAVYDGEENQYFHDRRSAEEYAVEMGINITEDTVFRASNRAGGYGTRYEKYTLPGGDEYRELLLTLPEGTQARAALEGANGSWRVIDRKTGEALWAGYDESVARSMLSELNGGFRTNHFPDQRNILAHIRFNERTDAAGKRVLFIEEIQSDWGQKGAKVGFEPRLKHGWRVIAYENETPATYQLFQEGMEYPRVVAKSRAEMMAEAGRIGALTTNSVSKGPFVTDTKAWTALALKRMIAYAVDNGFDRVAWTTGEQQAARYDLSKQVDAVLVTKQPGGLFGVWADAEDASSMNGRATYLHDSFSAEKLPEVIGKELAQRALEDLAGVDYGRSVEYSGLDLKVGGAGMSGYYDDILPQVANDLLKKMGGGKVIDVPIGGLASYDRLVEAGKKSGLSQAELDEMPVAERKALIDSLLPAQPGFDITPSMREKIATEGLPLFSMNRQLKTGISIEKLSGVVTDIASRNANMPQVHVYSTPADPGVPPALLAEIRRQGALQDVEAAMHNGSFYVFADHIASEERAEFVLAEHEVAHLGLRGVFGKNLDGVLQQIYESNESVRAAAQLIKQRSNMSDVVATEEVLADLPTSELLRLKGWKRLVLNVRDWFGKHGFVRLANRIAIWLDGKLAGDDRADLVVADIVRSAREWVKSGKKLVYPVSETRLSRAIGAFAAEQIEVDGVMCPVRNSNGHLIAASAEALRNFWRWFGDSKVIDKEGRPLVVYRGEHGEDSGKLQSRLGSLSFGSRDIASIYATEPNNRKDIPASPRVMPVCLKIEKPFIGNEYQDPFLDLSWVEKQIGKEDAMRIARKFAGDIENTGNWMDDINAGGKFDSVGDFLDKHPERLGDLYFDFYRFLDDKFEVERLKEAGFDGAIHDGNGESAGEIEYKVFDEFHVKSAIGNCGTFDQANSDIRFSRHKVVSPSLPDLVERICSEESGPELIEQMVRFGCAPKRAAELIEAGRFEDAIEYLEEVTGEKVPRLKP